jgi:hypothetical protein
MAFRQIRRDQVVHSATAAQGHEDRAERKKLWKSIHYWLRPNACFLQKPLTAVMSPATYFHRRSNDLISDSISNIYSMFNGSHSENMGDDRFALRRFQTRAMRHAVNDSRPIFGAVRLEYRQRVAFGAAMDEKRAALHATSQNRKSRVKKTTLLSVI